MITIQLIDREHKADINIPNEPFKLFGRMIPSYTDERWSYEVERLPGGGIRPVADYAQARQTEITFENSLFAIL